MDDLDAMPGGVQRAGRVQIFRFDNVEPMTVTGEEPSFFVQSDVAGERFRDYYATGIRKGIQVRVLVDAPGFYMMHARMKPGWLIPLHFHNGGGLYYVIAGSIVYGDTLLRAREGLYQPPGTPYQLKAGDEGAEILEIRGENATTTTWTSRSPKYWDQKIAAAHAAVASWTDGWPDD